MSGHSQSYHAQYISRLSGDLITMTFGLEGRLALNKTLIIVLKDSTHSAALLPPDVGRRCGLDAAFKRHGVSVATADVLQVPRDDR
jgi:hypothetical protein